MFYQESLDQALRFGDVLKGFVLATPYIVNPSEYKQYNLEINLPDYCVIISPCCSIGQKIIALSPLIEIRSSFFSNPNFEKDLTLINRKMEPHEAVSPSIWEKHFSEEERQKRLKEGKTYALNELFIFEQHLLLPEYELNVKEKGKIKANYYMIDFRNIHKVNCEKIVSNLNSPIDFKCLQLSVNSRSELREKLAFYFSRIPQEDQEVED